MRKTIPLLAAIVCCVAAATTCLAHSFPAKAAAMKAALVQDYPPCVVPDTTTSGGRPACLATEEVDTDCLFGSKGSGTLSATISKTNVKVAAKIKGLDPLCEGRTLTPAFTVRTTTDDCPDDHCTVVDYELTGGSCTVSKGKCKTSASIPGGYPAGAGSEMTIVRCGIKDGEKTAFTCGVMVK